MQQGAKYDIAIQPGKTKIKGFRIHANLRDANGFVVHEVGPNSVGVRAFVPDRTGIHRLEVVAEEGAVPYTLIVIRSGAVFVDMPKGDMPKGDIAKGDMPKGNEPGAKPAHSNVTQNAISFKQRRKNPRQPHLGGRRQSRSTS